MQTNPSPSGTPGTTSGSYDVFRMVFVPFDAVLTVFLLMLHDTSARQDAAGGAGYTSPLLVGGLWILFCVWLWLAMKKQAHAAWTGAVIFSVKILLFYGWLLFFTEGHLLMRAYRPFGYVVYDKHFYALALLLQLPFLWQVLRRRDLFNDSGPDFFRRYRSDEEIPVDYMNFYITSGRIIYALEALLLAYMLVLKLSPSLAQSMPESVATLQEALASPLDWLQAGVSLAFACAMLWALGKRLPIAWYIVLFNSGRVILTQFFSLLHSPATYSFGDTLYELLITAAIGVYWYKRKCLFIPDGYTPTAPSADGGFSPEAGAEG